MSYDDMEARELISWHCGRDPSKAAERIQAAKELLEKLKGLDGVVPGFKVNLVDRGDAFEVCFGSRKVCLGARDVGVVLIGGQEQEYKPVDGIELDLLAMPPVFVGTEEDKFLVPTPGQPRGHRSALAVVVEAALKQLLPEKA